MTTKDKANDIYSKMLEKQLDSQKYKERVITSWTAKHCALICVDEVIKELVEYYPYEHENRIYWREVKQELNQL